MSQIDAAQQALPADASLRSARLKRMPLGGIDQFKIGGARWHNNVQTAAVIGHKCNLNLSGMI
jgi:hypothetical protein